MTSLTSRRSPRQTEATQLFVVFPVQFEWFALPIPVVHKVVPLMQVYGMSPETNTGLTRCHDQEVVVIDASRRIFGHAAVPRLLSGGDRVASNTPGAIDRLPSAPVSTVSPTDPDGMEAQPYLLILQTGQNQTIGIPLSTLPILRRVAASAFAPVPSVYAVQGSVQCVNALITLEPDQPPVFLLDLDQLLQRV